MRCKNFSRPMSAGVQLGLVLTTITPFSTGAAAHQQVCEALESALKAAAEGKVTSPAALDVPALAQQLGRGGGSKGQGAKGKPTTRQIHLAYRALEAFMDADEDEQEKDVKELGQLQPG
jgi:hypothetical protein